MAMKFADLKQAPSFTIEAENLSLAALFNRSDCKALAFLLKESSFRIIGLIVAAACNKTAEIFISVSAVGSFEIACPKRSREPIALATSLFMASLFAKVVDKDLSDG
jgi:hypothetical protein